MGWGKAKAYAEGCYQCGAYPNSPHKDAQKLFQCKSCKYYMCQKHTTGGFMSGKKCSNCQSSKLKTVMSRIADKKIAKGGIPKNKAVMVDELHIKKSQHSVPQQPSEHTEEETAKKEVDSLLSNKDPKQPKNDLEKKQDEPFLTKDHTHSNLENLSLESLSNSEIDPFIELENSINKTTKILFNVDAFFLFTKEEGVKIFNRKQLPDIKKEMPKTFCVCAADISDKKLLNIWKSLIENEKYFFGSAYIGQRSTLSVNDMDNFLTEELNENDHILAIGPLGINPAVGPVKQQYERILCQIDIAKDFALPLFITHFPEEEGVLKKLTKKLSKISDLPIIYTDILNNKDSLNLCLNNNYYVLVRPEITHIGFHQYCENIKQIPQEKLLIASGDDVVAPADYQNDNSPLFIKSTLKKLAEIKTINEKGLQLQLNKTFLNVFYGEEE